MPSGFELYEAAVNTHAALVAPAGIPEDVLSALSDASGIAAESDTYAEVMANLRFPITYMPAAEAQAELAAQAERFAADNQ